MKATVLRLFVRSYRALLHLYPSSYRVEFEDEMRAVHAQVLDQAARRGILPLARAGLWEWLSVPHALLRVHGFSWWKRARTIVGNAGLALVPSASLPPPAPDGRTSWVQAGLEASLFLSMGAILVLRTYLALPLPAAGSPYSPDGIDGVALMLPIPLLLVGLARGLPRWAYPFGGILLGYSVMAAIRLGAWPLLVAFLLAALLLAAAAGVVHARVRPLPPYLRRMGRGVWRDWTRLSFCVYGVMPLLIAAAFDDARHDNRTPYLALSALLMVAGAVVYIRSRRVALQVAALLGGMSLSLCCALLDQACLAGGLADVSWVLRLWASVAALIAGPSLIGLGRRALDARRAA
jgi:hypothetical protein